MEKIVNDFKPDLVMCYGITLIKKIIIHTTKKNN